MLFGLIDFLALFGVYAGIIFFEGLHSASGHWNRRECKMRFMKTLELTPPTTKTVLGGVSKDFFLSIPKIGEMIEMIQFDIRIFFRWVG